MMTDLPTSVHQGTLRIGDLEIEVHVLDNGERVIEGESMQRFIAALTDGTVDAAKAGEVIGRFLHLGEIEGQE